MGAIFFVSFPFYVCFAFVRALQMGRSAGKKQQFISMSMDCLREADASKKLNIYCYFLLC